MAPVFAAFCLFLRDRRIKKTAPKARAPRAATPPTTPPTIAPTGVDFLLSEDTGVTVATPDPERIPEGIAALFSPLFVAVCFESPEAVTVTKETATSDLLVRVLLLLPLKVRWTDIVKAEAAQPCSVKTVRVEYT